MWKKSLPLIPRTQHKTKHIPILPRSFGLSLKANDKAALVVAPFMENGKLVSETVHKVEILNRQFCSVFTCEASHRQNFLIVHIHSCQILLLLKMVYQNKWRTWTQVRPKDLTVYTQGFSRHWQTKSLLFWPQYFNILLGRRCPLRLASGQYCPNQQEYCTQPRNLKFYRLTAITIEWSRPILFLIELGNMLKKQMIDFSK